MSAEPFHKTIAYIVADWMLEGACRNMDPELFFPERGEVPKEALEACLSCPVSAECLDYALHQSPHLPGVWGGTSERQRRDPAPNA